jgi:hypothetical protein
MFPQRSRRAREPNHPSHETLLHPMRPALLKSWPLVQEADWVEGSGCGHVSSTLESGSDPMRAHRLEHSEFEPQAGTPHAYNIACSESGNGSRKDLTRKPMSTTIDAIDLFHCRKSSIPFSPKPLRCTSENFAHTHILLADVVQNPKCSGNHHVLGSRATMRTTCTRVDNTWWATGLRWENQP